MTRRAGAGACALARRFGVAALQVLLISCGRAAQEAPEPGAKPAASNSARVARLRVSPPAHDFGSVVQGDMLHASFETENIGSAPLPLLSESRALGCVGRPSPELLVPGARGTLEVTCESEFYGPLRVTLPLATPAEPFPGATLLLSAAVLPRLSFDTPLLDLSLRFGEVRSADVHLVGALVQRAKLALVDTGDVSFGVDSLPASSSGEPGFRLTVKGTRVGNFVGNLRFTTNLPNPAEVVLPYSCKVLGTLEVTPTTPYFNLGFAGPKQLVVSVQSSQPGFHVRAARILDGPFEASVLPTARAGQYQVSVRVLEEQVPEEARSAQGRLLIESNDRSEPRKELPLFGFGRLNRAAPPG